MALAIRLLPTVVVTLAWHPSQWSLPGTGPAASPGWSCPQIWGWCLCSVLVEAARRLDPPRLRRVIAHLRAVADPDTAASQAEQRHQQRGLWLSPTLDGLLEAEAGQTLLAALEPLTRPANADDIRNGSQRRADALTELARRALEGGRLPQSGGVRPQLLVTVDLGSLVGHCGPGVLGGAPTQPLEVGRSSRVVPAAQRAALTVRDGGCVFPGCQRPLAWCEAHHLRHWLHGGPTDLANLALLCRAHHRAVHEGGWRLTRAPDGQLTAIPPHRRHPRNQRRPTAA